MSKKVFLYAGQGSQKAGMGKDFYEEYEAFRSFIDGLNGFSFDIKKLMFEGPEEELVKTEYTQPCMGAFAAGVTKLLIQNGIEPEAACGLSLGEYGALYAAGVFSAEDYIKALAFRGAAMADAAEGLSCVMSAVLGADNALVEETCTSYDGEGYVTVSNYNCPGQVVLCGEEIAVSAVESALKDQGVRLVKRLKVGGPFHTKFMRPAGDRLEAYFREMPFSEALVPVMSNVTGEFYGKEEDVRALLVRQIQESVHLDQNLRSLLKQGYTDFIEIGPGKTMAGFLKKAMKAEGVKVNVRSIETVKDFQAVLGENS